MTLPENGAFRFGAGIGIVSAFTLAFAAVRFAGAIGGSSSAIVVMVSIGLALSLPRLTSGRNFAAYFVS